jgi:hypothetical protein
MKRNITLAIDQQLLRRARALAAQRGVSISRLLADELRTLVAQDAAYRQAMTRALAELEAPLYLGGAGIPDREALHDRDGLR